MVVAQCKVVITTDQAVRGGKVIELKDTVDRAVSMCPSVEHVFVAQRTGARVSNTKKDIPLEKVDSVQTVLNLLTPTDLFILIINSLIGSDVQL